MVFVSVKGGSFETIVCIYISGRRGADRHHDSPHPPVPLTTCPRLRVFFFSCRVALVDLDPLVGVRCWSSTSMHTLWKVRSAMGFVHRTLFVSGPRAIPSVVLVDATAFFNFSFRRSPRRRLIRVESLPSLLSCQPENGRSVVGLGYGGGGGAG